MPRDTSVWMTDVLWGKARTMGAGGHISREAPKGLKGLRGRASAVPGCFNGNVERDPASEDNKDEEEVDLSPMIDASIVASLGRVSCFDKVVKLAHVRHQVSHPMQASRERDGSPARYVLPTITDICTADRIAYHHGINFEC